jgi:hypothetical protein
MQWSLRESISAPSHKWARQEPNHGEFPVDLTREAHCSLIATLPFAMQGMGVIHDPHEEGYIQTLSLGEVRG